MNKLIIFMSILGVISYTNIAFAKDTTVVTPVQVEVCEQVPSETCEDVTREVCETNEVETCETIHHNGYWKWVVWRHVWVSPWDEEVCTTENVETCENVTETVCEPTEETECHMETRNIFSTHKTFTKDTRCLASKPDKVTWASYDPKTSTINWSAVGGDKVELNFGWVDYQYKVILTNDGHEKVGLGTDIGYWVNHFRMRTINECTKGNWTYF